MGIASPELELKTGLEIDIVEVLLKSTSSFKRLSAKLKPPTAAAVGVDQKLSSAGSAAATGVTGRFGAGGFGLVAFVLAVEPFFA